MIRRELAERTTINASGADRPGIAVRGASSLAEVPYAFDRRVGGKDDDARSLDSAADEAYWTHHARPAAAPISCLAARWLMGP
jgi:hypothetical protein